MRSKNFVLKTVAVFMAINILSQVLAPTALWALTSGPTTPEVTSFEPVDTTDMVNLSNGDFTYNIPLLEVPGPEGGYPISLAYHGGIMPAQDASWVGLGWNLNPGCINRTANNFADDYHNALYSINDTWNGGTSTSYTLGVGVGLDDVLSVGVNVGIQHDTYKGTCGTFGIQMGLGIEGTNLGVGVSMQSDGWGNSSSSVYVGSNSTGLGMQLTAGTQGGQSFANISAVSNLTQSSMGFDLSSGNAKFSATPTSMLIGNDDRAGQISTETEGFNIPIQIYCFYISLGYKYTRYWSSTNQTTSLYGVLYSMDGSNLAQELSPEGNGITYDCSVLLDPAQGMALQGDRNWSSNASLPSYDTYLVMGQGIGGAIEPAVLDNGSLFRNNYNDYSFSGNTSTYNGMHFQSAFARNFYKAKHFFRFINDFSNSHVVSQTNFSFNNDLTNSPHLSNGDLAYTVNNVDTRGYTKTLTSGNVTEARFAGSKHVEYYTNAEITDLSSNGAIAHGFINTSNPNVVRGSNGSFPLPGSGPAFPNPNFIGLSQNIGGYTITNEKGVSYHYALPVYTFNFNQVMQQTSASSGITTRTISNYAPYAYTWLLTAVTGPDYVDSNKNGLADATDWGYWVTFDYGKFQGNAGFQTPETGSTTDIEGSTIYSNGAKEIYYLDAINTRTHTALFIKDIRNDGKGTNGLDYTSFFKQYTSSDGLAYGTFPATNVLKLSEVILIDNAKLKTIYGTYNSANATLTGLKTINPLICNNSTDNCDCYYQHYTMSTDGGHSTYTYDGYAFQSLWTNVLDMGDMNVNGSTDNRVLNALRAAGQKDIRFNYNYSLCPGTTNSFSAISTMQSLTGKLTLNSIAFYGNNNNQLMPSTVFYYDLTNPISSNITLTTLVNPPSAYYWNITTTGNFSVGDILTFVKTDGNGINRTYYGTLIQGTTQAGFQMHFMTNTNFLTAGTVNATQTKNPPYVPQFADSWGFFKSDYGSISGLSYDKSIAPTAVSAVGVDCWSLRSIQTATGATINVQYQSDDYTNVVLENNAILNIQQAIGVKYANQTTYTQTPVIMYNVGGYPVAGLRFYFYTQDLNGTPLTNYFRVNSQYKIYTIGEQDYTQCSDNASILANTNNCNINVCQKGMAYFEKKYTVTEVGSNYITVTDPSGTYFTDNGSFFCNTIQTNITPVVFSHANSFVKIKPLNSDYGGGVRTAKIIVTDNATIKETDYTYSLGTTPYLPSSLTELIQSYSLTSFAQNADKLAVNTYQDAYYSSYDNIIAGAKDLVGPGVLYKNVSVQNSVTKNGVTTIAPVYQGYEFQTFTADMITFADLMSPWSMQKNTVRTIQITNNMSKIGNLLSVKNYDSNSNLLSETSNTYTSTPPNNQGRVDQVFNEQRKMNPNGGNEYDFGVVTVKTELPSVLQSTTTRDYIKGLSKTTTNTAFDFYSGAVTETQTTDSYGNTYIAVNEPAYNYYTYYNSANAGMGIKLVNNSTWQNANMLTQSAANYTLRGTGTTASYSCTVTPSVNNGNESTVQLTSGTLPMTYHIGSSVPGLSSGTAGGLSAPYITWIADGRTSFKIVGPAVSGSVPSFTLNQGTLLSASVNTWNNMWNYRMWNGSNAYVTAAMIDNTLTVQNENVWRQKSDYAWNSPYVNPDGSYISNGTSTGTFVPFTFAADYAGTPQTSSYWSKLNTSTLFTSNSKPLEAMDVNGRYSSTKFCNNETYVLASASNAKYTEFTHSGGEYYESAIGASMAEGEVLCYTNAFESFNCAHTGKQSFSLSSGDAIKYVIPYTSGTNLPAAFTTAINYRASVWVNANSLTNAQLYAKVIDNGSTTTSTVTAATVTNPIKCGNWYLLTLTFAGPVTTASSNAIEVGVTYTGTGSTPIYVDDFRFQPDVSSVTSYVYDQNTGLLTYVIDATNRYTRYQYDCRNRLIGVYKETTYGEVIVKQYNYNYFNNGTTVLPLSPCQ